MISPPSVSNAPSTSPLPPRIYYVNPLLLRGLASWQEIFAHARDLGFDTVMSAPLFPGGQGGSVFVSSDFDSISPVLGLSTSLDEGVSSLVGAAKLAGVGLMLDVVFDRTSIESSKAGASSTTAIDPRVGPDQAGSVSLALDGESEEARGLRAVWVDRLKRLGGLGITGFRCLGIERISTETWTEIIAGVRAGGSQATFLAWTPGVSFPHRQSLATSGFDGAFSSLAWWDRRQPWIADERQIHRTIGYDIAFPEAPFGPRLSPGVESREVAERRSVGALRLAAAVGDGLMIPMGFEYGATTQLDPMFGEGFGIRSLRDRASMNLSGEIRLVNKGASDRRFEGSPLKILAASSSTASIIVQSSGTDPRWSDQSRLVIANRDLRRRVSVGVNSAVDDVSRFLPLKAADGQLLDRRSRVRLEPGEVLIFEGTASEAIQSNRSTDAEAVAASPRLAIEAITPSVDAGRFPVKKTVGEIVRVEADIFGDGHDPLAAVLLWKADDEEQWQESPMQLIVNDRWWAEFPLLRLGRYAFMIEAWRNPFAIFRYELVKKNDARLDLKLEVQEGVNLVSDAAAGASATVRDDLRKLLGSLSDGDDALKTNILLAPETAALMYLADKRPFSLRSAAIPVDAEREGAGFASWYELFPRSQSGDPDRHGTFDDVHSRLADIRAMGFDVLYFPPIHPIGKTNRKGRNNSLNAAPTDPGSPYAIGSPDGGHDAIHPELGTFEDFRRLVDAAHDHGLEIALDLAIQASPDHPWLKEHPGWFDWRPDGTVRYAENPPKKYEDIVNVDFYAKDAVPSLWSTLRDVVQLWVDNGVKLFRVDNPHTKPFPFWEWLIADIRGRHPEVVFLSEAFTKPKVMYRLAKIGFSQSYTYFTWRDRKWELEAYMREITTEAPKDFFRPHFFVNTHDINPDFLQNAPRPAYLIRAALAATLSGLWGIYNGFELCEGRPDAKRKEYADSEKYEIRAWDWDRPGNIITEIGILNRIRAQNAALHSHLGLSLLTAWNENVLWFEKASAGRENVLLIAISLDPHGVQEADVEVPLWKWNLTDQATLAVEDLVRGNSFNWTGKNQHIRLDPNELPFSIWRVSTLET
jgi:starch synthase (maltosyl-transferring)